MPEEVQEMITEIDQTGPKVPRTHPSTWVSSIWFTCGGDAGLDSGEHGWARHGAGSGKWEVVVCRGREKPSGTDPFSVGGPDLLLG